MTDYILYSNGNLLYCYRHGDCVSYWQNSITTAITSSLTYMPAANTVYNDCNIIYQSHLPITPDSHPEYFI